mmetsp:Transcript_24178/g.35584  ORF Transcript_24178/g.35584 Transcript_24178/m.35584 type:complete len:154 (-) Transcript_24178:269-730(-)
MTLLFLFQLLLVILLLVNACALHQPTISRRSFFQNAIGGVASSALMVMPSVAAAATDAPSFVGTFSDPINHPGGTRTIELVGEPIGDYQLARVLGGGGIGEPKSYTLPAAVIGNRAIVIDFSPKGGPRDFSGILEKNGDIRFLRDNNKWPRLK